jgi:hypothetical protein
MKAIWYTFRFKVLATDGPQAVVNHGIDEC